MSDDESPQHKKTMIGMAAPDFNLLKQSPPTDPPSPQDDPSPLRIPGADLIPDDAPTVLSEVSEIDPTELHVDPNATVMTDIDSAVAANTPPLASPHEHPTHIGDRYDIRKIIGAGGFATVYEAWDKALNRDVAIKLMRPNALQDPNHRAHFVERFERESKLAASLEHPNLVPVYDTGVLDTIGKPQPYLVMKRLEGSELGKLISAGPMAPQRVLDLGKQALEALAFIHSQGVVHKDLKPSNYIITTDYQGRENLHLTDFGVAYDPRDEMGRMTQAGTLLGTVRYLAPEYLMSQSVSAALDVFQMGLILAEMITGKPVISPKTSIPQLMLLYTNGFTLPRELQGTRVGALIDKACELEPEKRHPDGRALLAEFQTLTTADFPSTETIATGGVPENIPVGFGPTSPATPASPASAEKATASVANAASTQTALHVVDEEPPRKSNAPVIILIALAAFAAVGILVAGGIALYLMNQDKEDDTEKVEIDASAPIKTTAPTTKAEKKEKAPASAPKEVLAVIKLELSSEPSGATIKIDGKDHGKTPTSVEFDKSKKKLEVEFSLTGHEPERRSITPNMNREVRVALTPIEAPKKKTKKKKKKPSPVTLPPEF